MDQNRRQILAPVKRFCHKAQEVLLGELQVRETRCETLRGFLAHSCYFCNRH